MYRASEGLTCLYMRSSDCQPLFTFGLKYPINLLCKLYQNFNSFSFKGVQFGLVAGWAVVSVCVMVRKAEVTNGMQVA